MGDVILGPSVAASANGDVPLVRFTTAGSVDDGKSTLIGRLLLDTMALKQDHADGLNRSGGGDLDLAGLTDGLEAERAQGITIDVAYRYFSTPQASFIIADAPGHEQYTRNMVTAASACDIAVLLIDASRFDGGELKPQTRRHAAIAAMMGLDLVVAINKMDLVDWSKERFEAIRAAFVETAEHLGLASVQFAPVAARSGDNVVRRGATPDWWTGPTLLALLVEVRPQRRRGGALRLPIQTVLRDGDARYYAGRVEAGEVRSGAKVQVGATGATATIAQVRVGSVAVPVAEQGRSVTVTLAEERDLARGDVIASPDARYTQELVAELCWLDQTAWTPGRRYRLRQGALETQALIETVRHTRDMTSLSLRENPGALAMNDVALVEIRTRDPVLADAFDDTPGTGAFVLIDPNSFQTCGAGVIRQAG